MSYLSVRTPDGQVFQHEFEGDSLRIGRSSSNHLVLQDRGASRLHAEIVQRSEGFFLIDEKSKNRTVLNGRPIDRPELLKPGDEVRIGSTLLVFNGPAREPSDPPRPQSVTPPLEFRPEDQTPPEDDGTSAFEATIPVEEALARARAGSSPGFPADIASPAPPASAERLGEILLEADRHLAFHRPLEDILDAVMDLAGAAVGYERGLLLIREGDRLVPKVLRAFGPDYGQAGGFSRTIAFHAYANREAVLSREAADDPRWSEAHSISDQDIRSVMCVPLWNNREVIGVLYVDTRGAGRHFTERDLQVLTFLGNIAAVKIDNASLFRQALENEALHRVLREASKIQKRLLPARFPSIPGYTVEGDSIPCYEVGGDLYDIEEISGGRYGLGLGDVAGKGLPAALIMSNFLAALRTLHESDLPPGEIIGRLNRQLVRCLPANRYVTFFYGVLDPAGHTLTYVNAGHPAPLLLRRDGSCDRLELRNLFLGCLDDARFTPQRVALAPGDLIICYSDGVTEQVNAAGEEFGDAGLESAAGDLRTLSAHDIIERILTAVDEHSGGARHRDDITLMIVKRHE